MACMTASMTRVGGMTVRMGLVCGASLGDFAVLWVKDDAALSTIKGEFLLVRKRKKK